MASSKTPENYILRIRCGPDYDTSKLVSVNVNEEHSPTLIDGPNFTGMLVVRVLNYDGLPSQGKVKANPSSEYFKGRHRRYSLMMQGRFKHEINGDDIIFGIDSDTRVRMPTGIGVAIKIAKWLDPSVEADLSCDKPHLFSPLICAMNSLGVFTPDSPEVNDAGDAGQTGKLLVEKVERPDNTPKLNPSIDIGKWSFHSRLVPENVTLLVTKEGEQDPPPPVAESSGWFGKKKQPNGSTANALKELGTYEKRKKYFADFKKRTSVTISPDHIYCMDFYDAYFDINTISLKLPGVSISAFRYWDGQPLRFVARGRSDPSKVYFTVWFEFLERSELGLEPAISLRKSGSTNGLPEVETSSIHNVPEDILAEDIEGLQKKLSEEDFKDAEEF